MRTNNTQPTIEMEAGHLRDLVKEVKETIATDVHIYTDEKPVFSAADLWNIQRMRKQRQGRRAIL